MVCPNCGHVNAATAGFCAKCGKPLQTQFCSDCGAVCPATAPTCPNGHSLPLPHQRLLGKGVVLANRYRIEKLLGCGGFGAVYLATDTRFQQRQVAVKENHDPTVLRAFLKEAEILANLHHPHLPRVSDFFQEQPPNIPSTRPYMVMDYIEGEELWERIQHQGKMSEAELAEIEDAACPGCGSCAGMFTANSMNCLSEALGLALPLTATIPAVSAARYRLTNLSVS